MKRRRVPLELLFGLCAGVILLAACQEDRAEPPGRAEEQRDGGNGVGACITGRIAVGETPSEPVESDEPCEESPRLIVRPAAETPPFPEGLAAVSEYLEYAAGEDVAGVTIGLQLVEPVASASEVGFYSYIDGEWRRIADVVLTENGTIAEGTFESPPLNLIVLRKK